MIDDGSEALQTALIAALRTALPGVDVVDHMPQEVPATQGFPFVVVGDTTARDWGTKDSVGTEQDVEIQIHSQYRGRKQIRGIRRTIYQTLHEQTLALTGGHSIVLMRFEDADNTIEADGLTYRGTMRLRVLLDYEPA